VVYSLYSTVVDKGFPLLNEYLLYFLGIFLRFILCRTLLEAASVQATTANPSESRATPQKQANPSPSLPDHVTASAARI
jgi:hypothetical protein